MATCENCMTSCMGISSVGADTCTTCTGTCFGSCMRTCMGSCGGTSASGAGSCHSCEGTCASGCAYDCMGSCQGGCDGYCDNNAMSHAISCGDNCSSNCLNTCVNGCNATCRGNAYDTACSNCVGGCEGSCSGTCIGEDESSAASDLNLSGDGVSKNDDGTWYINILKDLDIEGAVKNGIDTGDLSFILNASTIQRDDGRSLKARIDDVDNLNIIPAFSSLLNKVTLNGVQTTTDGNQNININIDLSTIPDIITTTAALSSSAVLSIVVNGETKTVDANKVINLGYLGGISLVDGSIPDVYFSDELKSALAKAKTNDFMFSITINGNKFTGVNGVIDLTEMISSIYTKPVDGIPLTDLTQDIQDAITVPEDSAESVTCNRVTTVIDENGAIPIDLEVTADPPIKSIKGNLISGGIPQRPEANLYIKINGTDINKTANNVFNIPLSLIQDNLLIDGKTIADIVNDIALDKLLGAKVGNKTFYPDANHVMDLGVYDTAYDGVVESVTGNATNNANPKAPTVNIVFNIGDTEVRPDDEFVWDITQAIMDTMMSTSGKNVQDTLSDIYDKGLKYLKVNNILQEPNDDGFVALVTPSNAYVRPAGGIPLEDLSPIFQNALTLPYINRVTVGTGDTVADVPIEDGIADFTSLYSGAYVKPSTGVPAADLDPSTRALLENLKGVIVRSVSYSGREYLPSGGILDLNTVIGGSFYNKPSTGIPAADFSSTVQGKISEFDKVLMSVIVGNDVATGTEYTPNSGGLIVIPLDGYYIMPDGGIPLSDLDPELQSLILTTLQYATTIRFMGLEFYADEYGIAKIPNMSDPANIDTTQFTSDNGEISLLFSDTQINSNLILSGITPDIIPYSGSTLKTVLDEIAAIVTPSTGN